MNPPVAGLLLAAGAGRRFGSDKAAAELGGRSFGDLALTALVEGGCGPVVSVVAPGAWWPDRGAAVVNPEPARGLSSSLRVGLDALDPDVDAVGVTLVDTPLVTAEHVRRLLAAHSSGVRIAVATYLSHPRTPVLLGREHWAPAARAATGDRGARDYLDAMGAAVTEVDCSDLGPWRDVDTVADLASLRGLRDIRTAPAS